MKRTYVRVTALMFAVVTSMLLPVASAASIIPAKLKAKASVSLRDKPSTSSGVTRYLRTGEVVTALAMITPSWYRIQDAHGVVGYVSSSSNYVTVYANAKLLASTTFYTHPSANSAIIRTLSAGTELDVKEKIDDSWYRAEDLHGNPGYVTTNPSVVSADFSVTGVILPMNERAQAIIDAGKKYLGIPYQFDSNRWDPDTFDCSDFTQTSFWEGARIVLPGDSQAQGSMVKAKGHDVWDWRQLQSGDLMFFMSPRSIYANVDKKTEPVTHVGIYIGNGQILHTYSIDSGGVRIDKIEGSEWSKRFLFGGSGR